MRSTGSCAEFPSAENTGGHRKSVFWVIFALFCLKCFLVNFGFGGLWVLGSLGGIRDVWAIGAFSPGVPGLGNPFGHQVHVVSEVVKPWA